MTDEQEPLEHQPRRKSRLPKIVFVASLVALSISFVEYQARSFKFGTPPVLALPPVPVVETEDGRQLLWATGARDLESGEWFDMTDSTIDPQLFSHGLGKDTIRAIDKPAFVSISDTQYLASRGIVDTTKVIGYESGGEAKAYPVKIMDEHELVNDVIGGKPLTVGW